MDKSRRRSPRIKAVHSDAAHSSGMLTPGATDHPPRRLASLAAVTPEAIASASSTKRLHNSNSKDPIATNAKKARHFLKATNIKEEPDLVASGGGLCLVKPASAISSPCTTTSGTRSRPSADECHYVVQVLGKLHPEVVEECNERNLEHDKRMLGSSDAGSNNKSVADGLVSTILSQNTTNANSTRAFQQLKRTFPTWEDVVALPANNLKKLQDSIRCGGLAKIKAGRIYNIMKTIQEERGKPCLEYLRNQTNEQVKESLGRFPGLGPKTISCVLLFTMGRAEFPVDTHVHRITKKIHWIPQGASREDAYDHLNAAVPPELKLHLHCLLIAHGKQCHRCAARGKPQFPPKDGTKLLCPLVIGCGQKSSC